MIMQKLRGNNEGFTLIELMIVIAIIGILAAIAIPNFLAYRQRSYNSGANADIKNAFTAAQAYFADYKSADLDLDKLKHAGFKPTEDVEMTIEGDAGDFMDTMVLKTRHTSGTKTYSTDSSGAIDETED